MFMLKTNSRRATLAALALMTLNQAHAVGIDVTAVTTGIADVGVALLAVIGAFLAVSVLILGIGKVYGFVKRKAGA